MIFTISLTIRYLEWVLLSLYVYCKILNIKDINRFRIIIAFSIDVIIVTSYTFFVHYSIASFGIVISLIFLSVFICTKSINICATFIALGSTWAIDILCQTAVIFIVFVVKILYNVLTNPQEIILPQLLQGDSINGFNIPFIAIVTYTFILSSIFIKKLFDLKGLKKGLFFLKNKEAIMVALFAVFIIIFTRIYFSEVEGTHYKTLTPTVFVIFYLSVTNLTAILLNYWWRYQMNITYQLRVKDRAIQELQDIIDSQEIELNKLKESNKFLSETVHRDNKIVPAMYNTLKQYMDDPSLEKTNLLNELNEMINERKEEIYKVTKEISNIAKTGIKRIDIIINYMFYKALEKNTRLDFVTLIDVKDIIEEHIQKNDLETLLADLLENSIIATSFSGYKKIFLAIYIEDGFFEINIKDTGIPFEIDTLNNLGIKKATTHKDTGGSGIGYLKIFEILRDCKASFYLYEEESKQYTFSKSIKIRFDGKNEFYIYSYRQKQIKNSNTTKTIF